MKQVLEFLGVVALLQGGVGLVHELTGWLRGWGVVQGLDVLDGYEVYGSVALVVLSFALFAAADSRGPG
ncbi:hypothetical protein [Streptomyces sp. MMBL 11-3]|uniref:hypothetical protein n=1 Tax=Streptomyces sp. MMBL 11-3 TaxID=3382639 RepID=UPI0039B3A7DF